MATAQEQEALNEVMQLLEATPDTAEPTGIVNLVTPAANDIPTKREKLVILVFDWQVQRSHRCAAHTRAGQAPV